jgi:hypothetical protein
MEVLRRIPMAIISKAVEVVLGPPRHLLALMLRVAARIAAGEWAGVVFGVDEDGGQIPVRWDYSDGYGDDEDECRAVEEEEDDEDAWWGAGVSHDGRYKSMPGGFRPPSPPQQQHLRRRRSAAVVEELPSPRGGRSGRSYERRESHEPREAQSWEID